MVLFAGKQVTKTRLLTHTVTFWFAWVDIESEDHFMYDFELLSRILITSEECYGIDSEQRDCLKSTDLTLTVQALANENLRINNSFAVTSWSRSWANESPEDQIYGPDRSEDPEN